MISYSNEKGFTLIEVLLALAVVAIALTALLRVNAQNIKNTERIKEKSISHWVAMQGVLMCQLHLIQVTPHSTQVTRMFDKSWYWRTQFIPTPVKSIKQLILSVSTNELGPYREEVSAYLYSP